MINLWGIVRIVLAGSAALAVAAGLTACTSGAEPLTTFTPTPTESEPSVEPSPTPTMTEEERLLALIPEDAKGDDLYAAEAMAKFFILNQPGMYRDFDTSMWEFLSLPDCEYCSSGLLNVQSLRDEGVAVEGGEFSLHPQHPETLLDFDLGTAYIDFKVIESPGKATNSTGEVRWQTETRDFRFIVRLSHHDDLWRISGVHFEQA